MAQSLSSADHPLANSGARADLIRAAAQWIAEREAEVKALNAEIAEYKSKHIKGDLGFKLADWNAIQRVARLEAEDRDVLIETLREGFRALGIGGILDWVAAAEGTGGSPKGNGGSEPGSLRQSFSNGFAEPNESARLDGHHDGMSGSGDYADRHPPGEPGHADYMLGLAEGEAERARVMGMAGNGHDAGAEIHQMHGGDTPPKRGRGRPRKQRPEEADAGAEF